MSVAGVNRRVHRRAYYGAAAGAAAVGAGYYGYARRVRVGARAFAFVGTDLTNRSKAVGFK